MAMRGPPGSVTTTASRSMTARCQLESRPVHPVARRQRHWQQDRPFSVFGANKESHRYRDGVSDYGPSPTSPITSPPLGAAPMAYRRLGAIPSATCSCGTIRVPALCASGDLEARPRRGVIQDGNYVEFSLVRSRSYLSSATTSRACAQPRLSRPVGPSQQRLLLNSRLTCKRTMPPTAHHTT